MDYHENYMQSINPTGGSFITRSADQSSPSYRAPASDAGAETKKRQRLLAELQQALADLPSEKALQIVDAQLSQDYPDRDILLGQLAEMFDEQQTGSAADAYALRMMAQQQPRPQPTPTQHPDRADGMTAEYASLEPVLQEPAEPETPEEMNDEQPQTSQEVTEELFTAFADFIGSLADDQKEQLRNLLLT